MSKLTYTAHVEPGQGMTFPDCKIVKGWTGRVKRGDKALTWSPLMRTKEAANQWATAKAKEYRAYRQQHGEGIEDAQARRDAAKKAERQRLGRMSDRSREMYELLTTLADDAELVKEWLPAQAIVRLDKVRTLAAFVETGVK